MSPDPLIEVRGLSRHFGGVRVVEIPKAARRTRSGIPKRIKQKSNAPIDYQRMRRIGSLQLPVSRTGCRRWSFGLPLRLRPLPASVERLIAASVSFHFLFPSVSLCIPAKPSRLWQ